MADEDTVLDDLAASGYVTQRQGSGRMIDEDVTTDESALRAAIGEGQWGPLLADALGGIVDPDVPQVLLDSGDVIDLKGATAQLTRVDRLAERMSREEVPDLDAARQTLREMIHDVLVRTWITDMVSTSGGSSFAPYASMTELAADFHSGNPARIDRARSACRAVADPDLQGMRPDLEDLRSAFHDVHWAAGSAADQFIANEFDAAIGEMLAAVTIDPDADPAGPDLEDWSAS